MSSFFSRSSSSSSSNASHRLVASRCPECGAPVDFRSVTPDQVQVKCEYCGTLIAIPGRSHAQSTTRASSRSTITVTSDGKLVKGGWGCQLLSWLLLVLIVGGVGVASTGLINSATSWLRGATSKESSSNLPSLEPFVLPKIEVAVPFVAPYRLASAPLLLSADDSAATQMVIAAYQNDSSLLVGFDPEKRAESWRSSPFSERYYEMGLAADAERIYVADGAKLAALERTSGGISWQSSLANNIQTGCTESAPCLQRLGEEVIALARDGTIQGFAGATGAPLWSRRLNSQPRQFFVSGDKIVLIDTDDQNRAVVLVLDGARGDLVHDLRPACTFPHIEIRPNASDQFVLTPDGTALVIVSSGSYACAWRYELAAGALTWSYVSEETNGPLPFTWSMSSLALADPVVYFVKDDNDLVQIYALDTRLQGATPQPLYQVEDYELSVLYPAGELLLVSANPDFARDEVELWAIDRTTGERRWQRKLETTHTFDEWVTHPTDQGLFLAVCSWDTNECRFEVIDLATGASRAQVRQQTDGSYDGAAWLDDQGYLTIDGKIYAIDLETATVEYTWP